MLKQRQQADVAAVFDPLEERDVAVARVQLHVVVEDVGNGSAAEQQADQLLGNGEASR